MSPSPVSTTSVQTTKIGSVVLVGSIAVGHAGVVAVTAGSAFSSPSSPPPPVQAAVLSRAAESVRAATMLRRGWRMGGIVARGDRRGP